jgi:hypothetical protein
MGVKAPKIMIIRHAEKPAGKVAGVDEAGESSGHHLSVRGWQRAGALACLFAPAQGPLQSLRLFLPLQRPPTPSLGTQKAAARRRRSRLSLS